MKQLFFEALELPAAEREPFVGKASGLDPELKSEVLRLIESHACTETFLSDPAVNPVDRPGEDGLPRLRAGMLLAGRFQILRFISSGGMGEVYEAEDLELRERVALKTIRARNAGDESALELFKHEIQLARRVTHPNVCRIFDLERHSEVDGKGREEAVHFLTMELLEGQPLSEYLKEKGPFSPAEALPLVEQMASALEAAHEAGVIHRDFKPGNVLLVRKEPEAKLRAVVTDFGLALPVAMAGGSGRAEAKYWGGTPGYMPPEQLEGGEITTATDVYAFGTVVAEMVGGKRAEEKKSLLSTLLALPESRFAVSLQLPESCAGWKDLLQRCVEVLPGRRFQRAAEVVEALKATDPRRARSRWLKWLRLGGRWGKSDELSGSLLLRWPILVPAAGILAAATSLSRWWPVVPPPVVTGTVQLTSDEHRKFVPLSTDGRRLYFSEEVEGRTIAAAVPVSGGEPEEIPTPLQNVFVQDVSPQGTELLVIDPADGDLEHGGGIWVVPTAGGKPRRVGDLDAMEARWSPDGRNLLYIRGKDLYAARSDGTGSRKLVSMPNMPYFPSWSPDGNRISISAVDPENDRPNLWELNADGSNLHRALAGWSGEPFDCAGRWTTNGQYFLFDSFRGGPDSIYALRERGRRFERWSREPVRLTSGPMATGKPVPSRDGERIFFLGDTGYSSHLSRYDTKSGAWRPFLSGISAEQLDYSSDGQWVVYTSIPQASLFKCRMDGSRRKQLTSPPLLVASPRWSPDGKRIVFMGRLPGKPWKIYLIPSEGGVLEPLLREGWSEWFPGWMPDGNSLVFCREISHQVSEEEKLSKHPLVWIMDLRSRQTRTIPGTEIADCPRVSPDGRYLVLTCFSKVMLYDFSTQQWEELARDGEFRLPSWSHDSKYVYFCDWKSQEGLYDRVGIRDRKREGVVNLGGIVGGSLFGIPWVGLTPDEAPLAPLGETNPQIFAIDWKAP